MGPAGVIFGVCGWAFGCSGGLVVAVGVEDEFSEEFAGGGVDDSDVEVLDEQDDVGSGVGSADADVVVSDGDGAAGVDAVVPDPLVGVAGPVGAGGGFGSGGVGGGRGGREPGPLFTSMRNKSITDERLSGNAIARMLRNRARDAGLPAERMTPHCLRAGHATTAAIAGVSLDRIAARPATSGSPHCWSATSAPPKTSTTPPAATSGCKGATCMPGGGRTIEHNGHGAAQVRASGLTIRLRHRCGTAMPAAP